MRRPRSSARINLRFASIEEMDVIELRANKDGLDLQSWIRQLVRQEIRNKRLRERLMIETYKSQMRIETMLQSVIDEAIIRQAEYRAESRFENMEMLSEHELC